MGGRGLRLHLVGSMLALLVVACEAHRFPLVHTEPLAAAPDLAAYRPLRVGVVRPPDPDRIDETDPQAWREKLDAQRASWRAEGLIRKLDSTDAFLSVGYPDELAERASAVLEPLEGAPHEGPRSVDSVMITMLTLGIVPVHHRFDQGVHFRRVDEEAPDFHCEWPVERVVGWLGLALRLLPSWESGWAEPARKQHLLGCLESYGAANLQ